MLYSFQYCGAVWTWAISQEMSARANRKSSVCFGSKFMGIWDPAQRAAAQVNRPLSFCGVVEGSPLWVMFPRLYL